MFLPPGVGVVWSCGLGRRRGCRAVTFVGGTGSLCCLHPAAPGPGCSLLGGKVGTAARSPLCPRPATCVAVLSWREGHRGPFPGQTPRHRGVCSIARRSGCACARWLSLWDLLLLHCPSAPHLMPKMWNERNSSYLVFNFLFWDLPSPKLNLSHLGHRYDVSAGKSKVKEVPEQQASEDSHLPVSLPHLGLWFCLSWSKPAVVRHWEQEVAVPGLTWSPPCSGHNAIKSLSSCQVRSPER